MPTKWFIPIPKLTPTQGTHTHLHAAFGYWFDGIVCDHDAPTKPYSITTTKIAPTTTGVIINTLTNDAATALKIHATPEAPIRLGHHTYTPGHPKELHTETWPQLATPSGATTWHIKLNSPTTFRKNTQSSPLPRLDTIIKALDRAWQNYSDTPKTINITETLKHLTATHVTLNTTTITTQHHRRAAKHWNTATGSLTVHCDSHTIAPHVDALIRLAHYTGLGSLTTWGFGATTITPLPQNNKHHKTHNTPTLSQKTALTGSTPN